MRISDWSSDVCSSDLIVAARMAPISLTEIAAATGFGKSASQRLTHTLTALGYLEKNPETRRYRMTVRALDLAHGLLITDQIGRAWCRERVCQDVSDSVVAAHLHNKQ